MTASAKNVWTPESRLAYAQSEFGYRLSTLGVSVLRQGERNTCRSVPLVLRIAYCVLDRAFSFREKTLYDLMQTLDRSRHAGRSERDDALINRNIGQNSGQEMQMVDVE